MTQKQTSKELTKEEAASYEDYQWALEDQDVRDRYCEKVVVVHRKRVLGAGINHDQAFEEAQKHPDFPSGEWRQLITYVAIPWASRY